MGALDQGGNLPPCDRCGREVRPWPLKRPNVCSPDHWARCIRNDGIYAAEGERAARAMQAEASLAEALRRVSTERTPG